MKLLTFTPKNPLRDWTDAKARKATLLRLEKAGTLLSEIAVLWGDVDESAVGNAEDLAQQCQDMARNLQQFWAEGVGE